jgi:hypothetical protein
MTALVLLYLLHFKKVDIDNEDYTFDISEFINLSKPIDKKISNSSNVKNNSLFD